MLLKWHAELDANKATGIDQVTKEQYERNLVENINNLVKRLKNKRFRPQPVRRAFILKDEKSMRPLEILVYEDKIVTQATKGIPGSFL